MWDREREEFVHALTPLSARVLESETLGASNCRVVAGAGAPLRVVDWLRHRAACRVVPGEEDVAEEEGFAAGYSADIPWPSDAELADGARHVYLSPGNFPVALSVHMSAGDRYFHAGDLPPAVARIASTRAPVDVVPKSGVIPFRSLVVPDAPPPSGGGEMEVLQFIRLRQSPGTRGTMNYRRFKLSDYLSRRFGGKYRAASNIDFQSLRDGTFGSRYRTVIMSASEGSSAVLAMLPPGYRLAYDRTDNWSALGAGVAAEEAALIERADVIFCSARYLYDTLPEKCRGKALLIPNGCDVKPYSGRARRERRTAAYIGRSSNKVDWGAVRRVAAENPQWDVLLFGDIKGVPGDLGDNVRFMGWLPEDRLHERLEECHVGLVPFLPGEWTRGMLPLKLFHYANARIPTLHLNCPECDGYPGVAFRWGEHSLDELADMDIPAAEFEGVMAGANWKEKFDAMMGALGYED